MPPGDRCVRILHLEDSFEDAELIGEALRSGGMCCEITRVASADAFTAALERGGWGLIIADYHLPAFDGLAALAMARDRRPEVPFLIVSGAIGEERAVDAMRAGADDYVMKQRLPRLAPAALRAVREAEERREGRDAERRGRVTEDRLRLLVEHMPDLLWTMDASGRPAFVTPNTEGLTGFPVSHYAAEGGTAWFESVHPEERAEVEEAYAALRAEDRPFALEYRIRHRSGRWVWVRDCAAPAFPSESVRISCGLISDVSERRRMEDQLRQAQKMEAVGQLAGGVAHDFNNLLTVIMGYADFLLSRTDREASEREALNEMRDAGARAVSMTRQLLAFSRKHALRPRPVSWNEVVAGMEKMLRRLIPANIRLDVRLGEATREVMADPGQLDQVLLNLVVNARDAMGAGGIVTVATGNVQLSDSRARNFPGGRGGPWVLLSVTDTGVGMDEETRARLFEPFYTTKGAGKGTGLGLTTVHGIVTSLGGVVEVQSAPDQGATFRVFLPRGEGERPPSSQALPLPQSVGGSETVLLVEDSESVRRLTREILRTLGYRVLDVPDAERAEELSTAHSGRIDLLLTDAVLPGRGGVELARRIAQSRPEIRVVIMSGYDEAQAGELGLRGKDAAFLQKPFSIEQLAQGLREALDRVSK